MAARRRGRWHAQNRSPAGWQWLLGWCWVLCALSLGMMVAAPLVPLGPMEVVIQLLMAAALLGLLTSPPVVRGSWRLGVAVDDEALHERFQLGGHRRWPWADLTAVHHDAWGAVLCFGPHRVRVAAPLADWAELARAAEQRLDGDAQPLTALQRARGALSDHQLLDLLGHPPDGQIVSTTRFWRCTAWLCGPAVLVALWLALPTVFLAPAALMATGLPAVLGRRSPRRVHEVRAGVEGLSVRSAAGWRVLSWAGLRDIRRHGWFRVVTSDEGDLWLPPGLAYEGALLQAIGGVIRARERGYVLPRLLADVPEAALSRAEASVEAARGLSAADAE